MTKIKETSYTTFIPKNGAFKFNIPVYEFKRV